MSDAQADNGEEKAAASQQMKEEMLEPAQEDAENKSKAEKETEGEAEEKRSETREAVDSGRGNEAEGQGETASASQDKEEKASAGKSEGKQEEEETSKTERKSASSVETRRKSGEEEPPPIDEKTRPESASSKKSKREQKTDDPSGLDQREKEEVVDPSKAATDEEMSPKTRRRHGKPKTREGHREKRRHHSRRRPPTSESDVLGKIPNVHDGKRGASEQRQNSFDDPFEEIAKPIFQKADVDRDGTLKTEEFWKIFKSQQLNLLLSSEDLARLEAEADLDKDGYVSYEECVPVLRKVLMAIYQIQDTSPFDWVELAASDGLSLWFNKQTGDTSYSAPPGYNEKKEVDLFEDMIYDVFVSADTAQRGYLSQQQFVQLLQSETLSLALTNKDIGTITQQIQGYAIGRVTYEEFVPMARQLIMLSYQTKDPSASEWIQLQSSRFGLFWFNKRTGETRQQPPQELVMLQQQLQQQREAELEATKYELQEEQLRRQELESDVVALEEYRDIATQQLEETGQILDTTRAELQKAQKDLQKKTTDFTESASQVKALENQVTTMTKLQSDLEETNGKLQSSQEAVRQRESSLSGKEKVIVDLRDQINDLTIKLEVANEAIGSRNSSLADVTKELNEEKIKVKKFQKEVQQVPVLEAELSRTQEHLMHLQKQTEEKSSALSQTRRTMKNVRERNAELEKELGNMAELREKLHQSRCEIRTIKQFLSGKSTMVQERTRELKETKVRIADMEEKDNRRARILADILERTARLHQQQLVFMSNQMQQKQQQPSNSFGFPVQRAFANRESITRSSSCPSLIPEGGMAQPGADSLVFPLSTRRAIRYTDDVPTGRSRPTKPSKMQSVPRLPPVRQTKVHQMESFRHPTTEDVRRSRTLDDAAFPNEHHFLKTMATIDYSSPETRAARLTTTGHDYGYTPQEREDSAAAEQVKLGDRVLVYLKKNVFDLEPRTYSGVIKFVGKIDTEYVDNRIYAGIKLDEPVGEHDGIVKGKRYFKCPPRHGVMVRVKDVVSVLQPKRSSFKPMYGVKLRSGQTVS
eukprot:m.21650 g.21650  ORF g.21650 m.21650 type:complete len:1043 (+) comp28195_c0_seq3:1100-4228(+)